ncbi:hypothetical protein [Roseibium album]|uniref:hypothetical protein n=1 Tax=Roseibium album TaxID=311410 RepID=UPI0024918F2C|nr:hypothetical protein [Roseibium album]
MKRKISIPFVAWRDGRPRYKPGKNHRDMGLPSLDLRHPAGGKVSPSDLKPGTKNTGDWFGPGEAMDWSDAFQKQLAALQQPQKPAAPKRPRAKPTRATAPKGSYPLSQLIEDWKKSPRFTDDLAPKSRYDYASKMNVLSERYPDIWAAEIDAIDRPIVYGLYEDIRAKRGLSMARSTIRVMSSAFTWGLNKGKFKIRESNPCLSLGMAQPKPRLRVAERHELLTLVAAADAVGRSDMGDSFILGVWSGQRQGDRLALQLNERLTRRLDLRQGKTGALVSLPRAAELDKRLKVSEQRRRQAGVVSNHLILFENTWSPFNQDTYRHYFAEIRTIATNGLWQAEDGSLICPVNTPFRYLKHEVSAGPAAGECLVKPCPSLADFWEEDFRDTAVTWLALAGSTIPQICAVTGHSIQSATTVLKHYLALHADMADSAIAKMTAWYEETDDGN